MRLVESAFARIANAPTTYQIEQAREEALKGAYHAILSRFPHAPQLCFDWHFIDSWAEYLFEPFIVDGRIPHATAVAGAWAEQFALNPSWQKEAFQEILPMATALVYTLQTEVECTIPTTGLRVSYAM